MKIQFKLGETNLNAIWKNRHLKELDQIDGEKMEFQWINFPGFNTIGILFEIQKNDGRITVRTKAVLRKDHLYVHTMTLYGILQETKKIVRRIRRKLQHTRKGSLADAGHFWDQVVRKSGMELTITSQMVDRTELQS